MTKKEIHDICRKYSILFYTVNSDLSIDTDGVVLFDANLTEIPLKFNKVNGTFNCMNNKLTSLKNSPEYMSGSLNVFQNNIKTFDYFPKKIDGLIFLESNPIDELWSLFLDRNHIDYFNELDIIQEDGKVVILERLNYFLTDIGKEEVTKDDIKNYKVK